VLITGVFGAGKSSAAEEIADILEKRGTSYAVLDLDWLAWIGPEDEATHQRLLVQNLAAVVENYRAAGVAFYVLAYAVPDAAQLERLKAALGMPVKVVRLTVSLSEIRRRLLSDVTTARQDDLREAAAWLAASKGTLRCSPGGRSAHSPRGRPLRDRASRCRLLPAAWAFSHSRT